MTELLPCPFCGGPAVFEYVRHGGTMSSGMEPPTCYAGCKKCGVRFSGGETQGWDSTRRWYDRLEEAHDKAAEQWNTRHGAGDAEDSARLDFLCSGRQKKVERTLSDGWFRVYQDMASIMDPEHWRAMTDQFYETAREAIDAARAGDRG